MAISTRRPRKEGRWIETMRRLIHATQSSSYHSDLCYFTKEKKKRTHLAQRSSLPWFNKKSRWLFQRFGSVQSSRHHKIKVAEKTKYGEGFKALSLFSTITAIFKGWRRKETQSIKFNSTKLLLSCIALKMSKMPKFCSIITIFFLFSTTCVH